jgi:hypothetical protein
MEATWFLRAISAAKLDKKSVSYQALVFSHLE